VKIGPVDVEIIALTEITKKYYREHQQNITRSSASLKPGGEKHKQHISPSRRRRCFGGIIKEVKKVGPKGSPYSITERRVPELIPVLGSQPAGGRLPLLYARPAVALATLNRAATNFAAW